MTESTISDNINEAARQLLAGRLVAFPTETVYGLGADAENPAAVARLYAAKGRPPDHPVIVHVAPDANLSYWARNIPDQAYKLVEAFWPGPLTLILERADHIPDRVSAGQNTIGLRCPAHPVARQLLEAFSALKQGNGAVAAPSANKFGQVSPTQASHVREEFADLKGEDLLVLEGGRAEVGIESTILDLSRLERVGPVLLRPGHISAADIAGVLGVMPRVNADAAAPKVSGSLKAHYAPHTPLLLRSRADIEHLIGLGVGAVLSLAGIPVTTKDERDGRVAILTIGSVVSHASDPSKTGFTWVQAAENPVDYARDLYANLRSLDHGGFDCLLVQAPPQEAAWHAIQDRLTRASAALSH
ncbi:MAG: threonylcarbamoyl-AMP synthase [Pusillimonas sp.]|nr:threonylcarbamoyl-AMP synthase [Pusillimonas sp.]